jgi:regulation of enolase protein 1 (concanavalin A-like superfamily)
MRAMEHSATISAGAGTDWFVDPATGEAKLNAPAELKPVEGDFQLSARVEVEFAATFDAGVLALWHDERTWAKLCFERSPANEAMVVSVVTRGVSDDANSTVIDGNVVWLRVSRMGAAVAFHYSTDGEHWHLVRHFALGADGGLHAGLLAQSPTGEGCTARFSHVELTSTTLDDIRSGR